MERAAARNGHLPMSAKTIGLAGGATIVAVVAVVALIGSGSSDPTPASPTVPPVGESAPGSSTEATTTTEPPSGSQRGNAEGEADATDVDGVELQRARRRETRPTSTDITSTQTTVPYGDLPPGHHALRSEPALER